MKRLLLALIGAYRKYISPCRPPCCRFIPTCSAYALEAVEKYGAFKGGGLALRRILKPRPLEPDGAFCRMPAERPSCRPPVLRQVLKPALKRDHK